VDDPAALEGDDDERIERMEVNGDDLKKSQAQTCEAWFRRKVLQC
jgi:hypothetical protein